MFRNWEYIYQVYRERSFSRAAEKLHIAQPSLSLTIKKAEEKIGAEIFDRSSTPLRLTEFGEKYIEAVETLKKIQNDLENYIYETNELQCGHIAIGTGTFHLSYMLPPLLARFRAKYPKIQIYIHEAPTKDILQKLANGYIDFAITNSVLDEPKYKQYIVMTEKLVLAVPESMCPTHYHPDTLIPFNELCIDSGPDKPCVDLKLFSALPFITVKPDNSTRILTEKILKSEGITPQFILELDQAATMYRLAASGMGATIVSNALAKLSGPLGNTLFFRIGGEYVSRNICIYIKGGVPPSRAVSAFIEMAIDFFPDCLR